MPGFDFFAVLDGASPWWWVALAVAIGVVEMLTFSYYLIWIALAALAVGGALAVSPSLSGSAQLALFSVLAVGLTVAGRYWLKHRRPAPTANPALNRRSAAVVGRTGRALKDFEHREGVVVIDGVRWSARLAADGAETGAGEGRSLSVIGADGMVLICKPV